MVHALLSFLFEIVPCLPARLEDGGIGTARTGGDNADDSMSDEAGDNSDEGGKDGNNGKWADNFGPDETWVRVKECNLVQVEEQLDKVLELGMFCRLEPISLRFFPFRGVDGKGNPENIPQQPEVSREEGDDDGPRRRRG